MLVVGRGSATAEKGRRLGQEGEVSKCAFVEATNSELLQKMHEYQQQTHAQLKEDLSFLKQQAKPSYGRPWPQRYNLLPEFLRANCIDSRFPIRPTLSPNTRAVRIVLLESNVKSSLAALNKLSSLIQETGRGHNHSSAGRWKKLHSLGDLIGFASALILSPQFLNSAILHYKHKSVDSFGFADAS
ncbi:hypothetical protein E3N88_06749 [Mikania micrantha]|uniref:Uncharacterized protein n=1 Tax=Mikania micrantha TaxID=192012 RepID=A0A5N6PPK9_9ASTR|nr:hypothetical protein E3N88_06749 [Mikania micrantha]